MIMDILRVSLITIIIFVVITHSMRASVHANLSDKFIRFKAITTKHIRIRTARRPDGKTLSKSLSFSIFGRMVTLKLRPRLTESILAPGARIQARHANYTKTDIFLDPQDFYQGIILGHPGSSVQSVKLGDLWLIHTDHPNDQHLSLSIEPITFHITNSAGNNIRHKNKMVAFRHTDFKIFDDAEYTPYCQHDASNKNNDWLLNNKTHESTRKSYYPLPIYSKLMRSKLFHGKHSTKRKANANIKTVTRRNSGKLSKSLLLDSNVPNIEPSWRRGKKVITYRGNTRKRRDANPNSVACDLLSIADYTFFSGVGQKSMVRTAKLLVFVFERVNSLFWNTDFKIDGYNKQVGVKIRGMEIFTDMKVDSDISVYLNDIKSGVDGDLIIKDLVKNAYFRRYCLVHLHTQRELPHNALGLALTSQNDKSGSGRRYFGICAGTTTKSTNVGMSTVTFNGAIVPSRVYWLIVSHEIGHNFGANHDEPNDMQCSPSEEDGGKFLMWPKASKGFSRNNLKFSPCSKRDIVAILKERGSCFLPMESFHVNHCGNGIVDYGEDCDMGLPYHIQQQRCCTQACRFAPNAVCSPFNHPCCTNSCTIAAKGTQCSSKADHDCSKPARCDGVNHIYCLPSGSLPNGHSCGFKGECQNGKCIHICKLIGQKMVLPKSLNQCDCDGNSKEMCTVCCHDNINITSRNLCKPFNVTYPDKTPCLHGHCEKGLCREDKDNLNIAGWHDAARAPGGTSVLFIGIAGGLLILIFLAYVIAAFACSQPTDIPDE